MSEQVSTPQRPDTTDPDVWKAYWRAQGLSWRTEPEIDAERQKFLTERRAIIPDTEKGIYPFKDIKLNRADIEWLLATHEDGRGPVEWKDESQREREGLDLRGADLRSADLNHLPLARIRAGLATVEWWHATEQQKIEAGAHLEGAILDWSHLEGASFRWASLKQASLYGASLRDARLRGAKLPGAVLQRAHLEGASICKAYLGGEEVNNLSPANLKQAFFDTGTNLDGIVLGNKQQGVPPLVDISWGNVNLAVVDWTQIKMLGDEREAYQQVLDVTAKKNKDTLLMKFQQAVRANRQLTVALQAQGLNENASYFAYRAQKLQRIVLRHQKKFGQYIFSFFLDFLAGYGYRPGRSVLWYLAVILGFGFAYHFLGGLSLYPPDAFVFSIMSFHGRGFFPALSQETNLHNPLVMLAAVEAIIGLLIEISFIATFTQRFFGR